MTHDPVADAIARGDATARVLIAHRDALIYHMSALILITGAKGLHACAAGAAEAVVIAHGRRPADQTGKAKDAEIRGETR
jgi:hypothetical protein